MNISEFISQMEERKPPASEKDLGEFEAALGCRLPEDYREFLATANGGSVNDERFTTATTWICSMGGIPELVENRDCYQISERRIPSELLWIMDDAFSAAYCIGLTGEYRGKIYFWDNDNEPGSAWDGRFETAGNITLLANSFTEFIGGLQPPEPEKKGCTALAAVVLGLALTVVALSRF